MGLSVLTAVAAWHAYFQGDTISRDVVPPIEMKTEPAEQMLCLQPGDHLCLFYDRDPAEQMFAIVALVQQALQREEQFVYVADDQTVEKLTARLEDGGIGVKQETDRGRLKLWTRRE